VTSIPLRLAAWSLAPVAAALAVTLGAGFALKAQCLGADWDGRQFSRLCYNDVQPLYGLRGVDTHTFPYVRGSLREGELVDGGIEYPVLTGLFMWLAGLPAGDANEFFVVTAVLLAGVALVPTALLARMVGVRTLLWATSPALAFYAFHNWDLLAVAAAVAGFWFWYRGQPLAAAALFAVGGSFKLFPLLFLVPLALERLSLRDRRGAALTLGAGLLTAAAVNLPFAAVNLEGWWATYRFHQLRDPNGDSTWGLVASSLSPGQVNALSGGLTLLAAIAVLAAAWRQRGRFPFLPACAALLAVFLLFGKVQSPQYSLWIMPFFVLLRAPLRWWVAYAVVDVLVYLAVFRWLFDHTQGRFGFGLVELGVWVGVWGRAALLAALAVVFLRSLPVATPAR